MAGTGIIKVKYDSEYRRILDALEKASMPRLLDLALFAGGKLDGISKKAFEDEKDPVTGIKWKEIQPRRKKSRRKKADNSKKQSRARRKKESTEGATHPILRDGGQLYRSLDYEAFPDGSVIYGSNMVYARVHQKGHGAIEARPYIGIPKDFDRQLLSDPAVLKCLGLEGAAS